MIFGTQIGVAPGSLAMRFGGTMPQGQAFCPPDPIWRYFPSPFEPATYFSPAAPSPPPPPRAPIDVTPPSMEPMRPAPAPARTPVELTPAPTRAGAYIPYGTESRLSGLGAVGPFGMTWGGFLGVLALAIAGGTGLGYLYHRRS